MGYESRLYVVDKTTIFDGEMVYGQKVAMFDLCKVEAVSAQLTAYPETNVYFFADDGNTKVVNDNYGQPLTEIPLKDVINIIESAMKTDAYRRYKPCLELLKGFDESQWNNLVVLHYGH